MAASEAGESAAPAGPVSAAGWEGGGVLLTRRTCTSAGNVAVSSNAAMAQAIGLEPGQRSDRDVGYHIEVFYTHRVNDNITITPGAFWLTAPNHDERNPDVVVGAIRTTFSF